MKKILHVINGLGLGGAETSLYNLCLNDGNVHTVVSLTGEGVFKEKLNDIGVDVYVLSMSSPLSCIRGALKLYSLLRKIRPDIVQTWMYHSNLIGGIVAKFARQKNIYWNIRHSDVDVGNVKYRTYWVAKAGAVIAGLMPKKIVILSERAKLNHVRIGYPEKKIIVISNGVDCERFYPLEDLKDEGGLSKDKFLIGMVARYTPEKDHDMLVKSLSMFFPRHSEAHAIIVGKGVVEGLSDAVEFHNIKKFVTLLENVDDMPKFMNKIDLHVLTSKSEGFGNVIIESIASGTPCVSTDVGDARVILGDNMVICPGDYQAMSEKISELYSIFLNDSDSWMTLRSTCRKVAMNYYSITRAANAYDEVWSDKR